MFTLRNKRLFIHSCTADITENFYFVPHQKKEKGKGLPIHKKKNTRFAHLHFTHTYYITLKMFHSGSLISNLFSCFVIICPSTFVLLLRIVMQMT